MDTVRIKSIVFYVIVSIIVIAYFFIRLPELKTAFSIGTTIPIDFPQDYIAGRQLLMGKSVYPHNYGDLYAKLFFKMGYTVDQRISHINAHPPFAAFLLLPLCFLNIHSAIIVWCLITILCMFVLILLLIKSEHIPLPYFPVLCLFVLAWLPFQENVQVGQISILVALFIIAGWYFHKKNNEIKSGIFIALASMLKIYPGLLIAYFIINKKWGAFLSFIATSGIIVLFTFIVARHDLLYFIIHILSVDTKHFEMSLGNYTINGFLSKLFLSVKSHYKGGVFTASENYFWKNIVLSLMIIVIVSYTALNSRRYNYNNPLGYSVIIIISLLLSPIGWAHYLIPLLLPLIVFIKELIKKRTVFEVVIFLTALFFISIDTSSVYFLKTLSVVRGFIPGNPESFFYRMTFYSLPFYGMVLLLYLNFRLIKNYSTSALHDTEGGGAVLD